MAYITVVYMYPHHTLEACSSAFIATQSYHPISTLNSTHTTIPPKYTRTHTHPHPHTHTHTGENNPMFAKLAQLVGCGYPIKEEPLLAICLGAIQAWMARDMRNKTHVYVEEGCRLLGVMDETKTLQPGQIFAQVQRHRDERPVVLEGPVIVTRNPCLHPGDVLCLEVCGVVWCCVG